MKMEHNMHRIDYTVGISHVAYKLILSAVSGLALSLPAIVISGIRDLLISERDFWHFLAAAILIDLIVGGWKYLKLENFSAKKSLYGFIEKLLVCSMGMILVIIMTGFDGAETMDFATWFKVAGRIAVLSYPCFSAFKSLYVITDGNFPPVWFMKKMEGFESNMPDKN